MKTYIRRQQHKHFYHQDIKQKEPPRKYRIGTISNTKLLTGLNRFYMAITSSSIYDLMLHTTMEKYVKQIGAPFIVLTKLHRVGCGRNV